MQGEVKISYCSPTHPHPLPSYFSLIHILLTKHHSAEIETVSVWKEQKIQRALPTSHPMPPIRGQIWQFPIETSKG